MSDNPSTINPELCDSPRCGGEATHIIKANTPGVMGPPYYQLCAACYWAYRLGVDHAMKLIEESIRKGGQADAERNATTN